MRRDNRPVRTIEQLVNGLIRLNSTHHLLAIDSKSCTEGVRSLNGLTYWVPPLCATLWFNLSQRVYTFHMKVSNGLFHLKLLLRLRKDYGKFFTGGDGNVDFFIFKYISPFHELLHQCEMLDYTIIQRIILHSLLSYLLQMKPEIIWLKMKAINGLNARNFVTHVLTL